MSCHNGRSPGSVPSSCKLEANCEILLQSLADAGVPGAAACAAAALVDVRIVDCQVYEVSVLGFLIVVAPVLFRPRCLAGDIVLGGPACRINGESTECPVAIVPAIWSAGGDGELGLIERGFSRPRTHSENLRLTKTICSCYAAISRNSPQNFAKMQYFSSRLGQVAAYVEYYTIASKASN
jgi:hypothetical protein